MQRPHNEHLLYSSSPNFLQSLAKQRPKNFPQVTQCPGAWLPITGNPKPVLRSFYHIMVLPFKDQWSREKPTAEETQG